MKRILINGTYQDLDKLKFEEKVILNDPRFEYAPFKFEYVKIPHEFKIVNNDITICLGKTGDYLIKKGDLTAAYFYLPDHPVFPEEYGMEYFIVNYVLDIDPDIYKLNPAETYHKLWDHAFQYMLDDIITNIIAIGPDWVERHFVYFVQKRRRLEENWVIRK